MKASLYIPKTRRAALDMAARAMSRSKACLIVFAALMSTLILARIFSTLETVNEQKDFFLTTPMCDPVSGDCGEDPVLASPRTIHSAKNRVQYEQWWKAHTALAETAASYAESVNHNPKVPLILVGDSITESWLGTNMGNSEKRCEGIPDVLNKRFSDYNTLVLAIGGDQTQHVLYRLQHGELVPNIKTNKQAIFTLLIGTNNLGSGILPGPTAAGVLAVTEYLLRVTAGRIILQQLLPRGDSHRLAALCPPRCSSKSTSTPFTSFMPAVQKVNQALQDSIHDLQIKYPSRLSLVDCGSPFVGSQEKKVNGRLMPDQLHPNAAGHQLLANCLLDCIEHKTCS